MKMTKRFILPVMLCLATAGIARSQGLFFTVTPGYHFPAGKSSGFINGDITTASGNTTEKSLRYSFGKGLNVGASVGYMFNENMGLDLGLSYLLGGKYETSEKTTTGSGTTTENYTTYGRMFRITPSLIMQTGEEMKFYMRFGAVIGMGKVIQEYDESGPGGTSTNKIEWSGGLSTGLIGGIGFSTMLGEKMGFFAELQSITQSWAPTGAEVTEATSDGKDVLSSMPTAFKEVTYEDEVSSGPMDPNQPSKMLKMSLPFSSVGIQVGIKFNLGE